MTLDGRELTVMANQPYPESGAITDPVGGSWPAGTYSFKVAAWFWNSEGSTDNSGLIRISVPAWDGITVDANDKVTVNWTAANIPPDHYSIYYIENATWDNGPDGNDYHARKIAEVAGHILTSTILKPFLQQGASDNFASTTTGANSNTILIDSTATFQTNGMKIGDSVSNVTAAFTATVVSVDSEIQMTVTDAGTFTTGNAYRITSTTALEDTAATFITNGVEVGHYVILNAGASTAGAYAVITEVVSETVLNTAILSDSGSFTLNDSYDVVYEVEEFGLIPTTFVINPIEEVTMNIRPQTVRGYNGRLVSKSWAQISPLMGMRLEFPNLAITEANYKKICRWIAQGVRVTLTESTDASALITDYAGKFVNVSHLPTRYKSRRYLMWADFECELGTVT